MSEGISTLTTISQALCCAEDTSQALCVEVSCDYVEVREPHRASMVEWLGN